MDRALGTDIFNANSDGYDMGRVKADLGPGGFLIHKASQGWAGGPGGWIDWKFQGAIARARQAGIRRVAGYHWLLHGNPEAQADLFARALDLIGGRARVGAFVDYERNDWDQSLNPQADDLYRFMARARAIGVNRLLAPYTAPWYSDGYANARLTAARILIGCWWAGYVQRPNPTPIGQCIADVTPGYMDAFDGWGAPPLIRQWTSNGIVAGNPSDCDVTYLPAAYIDDVFGVGKLPPPPPPPVVDPHGVHRYDNIAEVLSLHPGRNSDAVTGGKVHVWQLSLNLIPKVTPKLAVDGLFGQQSDRATRQFQQLMKIPVDGVAGHQSWTTMGAGLTFIRRWIYDRRVVAPAALPPENPARLRLAATHSLSAVVHAQQGELYRDPARLVATP